MTCEQRQVTFAHSRFRGTREQLVNALNAMPIRGGISGQVVAEAAAAELTSNAARIEELEAQLSSSGFAAADLATASAQGVK